MRPALQLLNRYVNGGSLTKKDMILSGLIPALPFRRNAKLVSEKFSVPIESRGSLQEVVVEIPAYSGSNPFVCRMREQLIPLNSFLHSAILHGSLAVGEENSYSDFDAVVILTDQTIGNPEQLAFVSHRLNSLRTIMQEMDPLQHHGWLVLNESGLKNYSEEILPSETFANSKSLLEPFSLKLFVNADEKFYEIFLRMCDNLEKKIKDDVFLLNAFGIKSFLSEFMMLPALYVQARDGKGMFKKFSFESMRRDFHPAIYKPMDIVSAIRRNWKIDLTTSDKRYLAKTDGMSWARRKKIDFPMPAVVKEELTQELVNAMHLLVNSARTKISQRR